MSSHLNASGTLLALITANITINLLHDDDVYYICFDPWTTAVYSHSYLLRPNAINTVHEHAS
jgi:hypothetical protein